MCPRTLAASANIPADGLRYIHKVVDGNDVYFVANKNPQPEDAVCAFRVQGRRPELWWPDTGRIERPAVYNEDRGCTSLPLHLEPSGSVFVIFRQQAPLEPNRIVKVRRDGQTLFDIGSKDAGLAEAIQLERQPAGKLAARVWQAGKYEVCAAGGQISRLEVAAIPPVLEITGPWDLAFPPNWGAPPRVTLDKLISWSEHPDSGVKYFSGTATYSKTFGVPSDLVKPGQHCFLDLGTVAIMAQVKLNGKDLGILWKPPFRMDVTPALKAGENLLEIKVVNLWVNRIIGDEQLPEDSDRNGSTLRSWPQWLLDGKPSPTGRYTFTTWRLWNKTEDLVPSGLLGPVTIQAAREITVDQP